MNQTVEGIPVPEVSPVPSKTQQLHDELDRVEKEQLVLRNRLATLDNTHRWLKSEIKTEQKVQLNLFLAAKLSVLQAERNLRELARLVYTVTGNCLHDSETSNYSVERKDDWTILARGRNTTMFHVDGMGDTWSQQVILYSFRGTRGTEETWSNQVKEFNLFDVTFDELRSKVAQRIEQ